MDARSRAILPNRYCSVNCCLLGFYVRFFSLVVAKIVLVGNKNDLRMSEDASLHLAESNQEFVTMENGHAMAEKIGAYAYLECSAKLNYGVREVFGTAARAIFQ